MTQQPPPDPDLPGTLYVVATPIGHLDDLSARAIATLRSVTVVAAEDTRVTRPLLTRIGARARLIAAHQHNEESAAARVVGLLLEGVSVALVSDAGTPAISDPGTRIVAATREAGLRVVPIPGPSALTAMLSASGLAQGGFVFGGFLPQRAGPRERRLRDLAQLGLAVVLFEAPHRIVATCGAIASVFGAACPVAVGRELTKQFEEIATLPAHALESWLCEHPGRMKGEYVVVIEARPPAASGEGAAGDDENAPGLPRALSVQTDALLGELLPELGARRASRLVERLAGLPSGSLYRQATELQQH